MQLRRYSFNLREMHLYLKAHTPHMDVDRTSKTHWKPARSERSSPVNLEWTIDRNLTLPDGWRNVGKRVPQTFPEDLVGSTCVEMKHPHGGGICSQETTRKMLSTAQSFFPIFQLRTLKSDLFSLSFQDLSGHDSQDTKMNRFGNNYFVAFARSLAFIFPAKIAASLEGKKNCIRQSIKVWSPSSSFNNLLHRFPKKTPTTIWFYSSRNPKIRQDATSSSG